MFGGLEIREIHKAAETTACSKSEDFSASERSEVTAICYEENLVCELRYAIMFANSKAEGGLHIDKVLRRVTF
jgi:thermostable 8-oxoguanine DNA glycosylase